MKNFKRTGEEHAKKLLHLMGFSYQEDVLMKWDISRRNYLSGEMNMSIIGDAGKKDTNQ